MILFLLRLPHPASVGIGRRVRLRDEADADRLESTWPQFLPDGRTFLCGSKPRASMDAVYASFVDQSGRRIETLEHGHEGPLCRCLRRSARLFAVVARPDAGDAALRPCEPEARRRSIPLAQNVAVGGGTTQVSRQTARPSGCPKPGCWCIELGAQTGRSLAWFARDGKRPGPCRKSATASS